MQSLDEKFKNYKKTCKLKLEENVYSKNFPPRTNCCANYLNKLLVPQVSSFLLLQCKQIKRNYARLIFKKSEEKKIFRKKSKERKGAKI